MTAVGLSRFLDLYFYTVCSLTTGKLHNLFSVDSISLLEKQGLWPPEIPGFLKCKPIHQENPMFTFHTFLCFFFTFLQKSQISNPLFFFFLLARFMKKVDYVSKVENPKKHT